MSDDLERVLEALAQPTPDPPFDVVAAQRARLMAHINELAEPRRHKDSPGSRDPRRPRGPWISIAAALAIVALVSGVVLAIRLGDGSAGRARHDQVLSAGTFLNASTVEAMLVPGNMNQYQLSARRLEGFERSLRQAVDPSCTGGSDPGAAIGRYFDDPASIRSQGLPSQVPDAGSQCAAADVVLAPLDAAIRPVSQSWLAAVQTVEASDAVASALNRWQSCMSGAGHAVASIDDVYAEAQRLAASSTSTNPALDTLVRDYAKCLELSGVVSERQAGIARIRDRFLTQHAAELRAAESQLPGVIDSLSHRYGVSFPN